MDSHSLTITGIDVRYHIIGAAQSQMKGSTMKSIQQKSSHSAWECKYHSVWILKYRKIARTYMGRKKNFTGQSFWARGYHVSTVGRDEDMIKNYIQHQEIEDNRTDQLKLY